MGSDLTPIAVHYRGRLVPSPGLRCRSDACVALWGSYQKRRRWRRNYKMPITFESPSLLLAGILLALGAAGVAMVRRATAPSLFAAFAGFGFVLIALAAGNPRGGEGRPRVVVMVDESDSTRGADFRDEGKLRADVEGLIGDRPYSIVRFGRGANETRWTPPPPDTSAVLLFSDGRFAPPATSPPVYAVIDRMLDQPGDAAVTSLERRGGQFFVTATNSDGPRELSIDGAQTSLAPGTRTIALPASQPSTSARIAGDDRWPENDAMSLIEPPPTNSERWWVGKGAPGGVWRTFSAGDLPSEPAAWLAPSVIVFSNVDASALPQPQAARLEQYVRDLGGGLLILGGDHAFAAGGYAGSVLGALSPLASNPPTPAAHWVFLLDASGSMAGTFDGLTAGELNGRTRLAIAADAARAAVAQLPPNDALSVAGFADQLRWWSQGKAVKDGLPGDIPIPRGPTNLDASLRAVASSLDKSLVNHVVLLTDGQIDLPKLDELARALKSTNARIHVFAIGEGPGLPLLIQLAGSTGGSFADERDAGHWARGLVNLLRQVTPRRWMTTPIEVRFNDLALVTATEWNVTWLKTGAEEIGRSAADDAKPMAAQMNVGSGKVIAVAFGPPPMHVEALAALVQNPPRDPRIKVTWRTGRHLVVDMDTGTINGLSPTLALTTVGGTTTSHAIPQTGPGRYMLSLTAPRESSYVTVFESGRVLDRFAVAGRYPAEFDGIGNDRIALASLAGRTGGKLIEPAARGPLQLPAPAGGTPLGAYFAAAGAALIAFGLVAWRVKA
jgi:hypothetical protein